MLYPQVDSEQDCSLRASSKARGMKMFVPGFRSLYDTAKGPDSGVAGGLGTEFGSDDYSEWPTTRKLARPVNTRAFMGSCELDMSRIYYDAIVTKRKMRSWQDLLEGR